jgi:hypothetical protein
VTEKRERYYSLNKGNPVVLNAVYLHMIHTPIQKWRETAPSPSSLLFFSPSFSFFTVESKQMVSFLKELGRWKK